MKRFAAILALFLIVFMSVLSGCSADKKPDIDGFRSYLRTYSITTSLDLEYNYDSSSGVVSITIRYSDGCDLSSAKSVAGFETDSVVRAAKKYNIGEISVKVSVLDADGGVIYSETDGVDDEVTRDENFRKVLRYLLDDDSRLSADE